MTSRRHDKQIVHWISAELLESRHLLSAVSFVGHSVPIVSTFEGGVVRAPFSTDLDQDGDNDVLLIETTLGDDARSEIRVLKNADGMGNFEGGALVDSILGDRVHRVLAGDLDGDGDMDIVTQGSNGVGWYENIGGSELFGDRVTVDTEEDFALMLTDIDADSDVDILTNCHIYENDSKAGFEKRHDAAWESADTSFHQFTVADIDTDDDLDIVAFDDRGVYWFENADGGGPVDANRRPVSPDGSATYHRVKVADLDHDGDVDIVASRFNPVTSTGDTAWFENDGHGQFGAARLVEPRLLLTYLSDFDVDGDIDIVATNRHAGWLDNVDGAGTFVRSQLQVRRVPSDSGSGQVVDIDQDGDADLLLPFLGEIRWYENRLHGDVDDDGEVGFSDFLALAASFGKSEPAIWDDGDLDGDGEVSFADFLELAANFGQSR